MLVTLEPISRSMAGPAIRAVEMGKQLAREFSVTVVSPVAQEADNQLPAIDGVKIVTGANRHLMYEEALANDVLIIQSNVLRPFPTDGAAIRNRWRQECLDRHHRCRRF